VLIRSNHDAILTRRVSRPTHVLHKVKQISRLRLLTKREAAKYRLIRRQIEAEMPQLQARLLSKVILREAFHRLKEIRLAQGKSLADLKSLTGMDRSS
jgi:hypothetical protein